ncbi:MAG: hypothetical protein RR514_06635 [Christensenella sp.]
MRCECAECGMYMVHAEDLTLGCICPACLARCTACLGTNSVLSREELNASKDDPAFVKRFTEENSEDNSDD